MLREILGTFSNLLAEFFGYSSEVDYAQRPLRNRPANLILLDICVKSEISESVAINDYYAFNLAVEQIETFLGSKNTLSSVIQLPEKSGVTRVILSWDEEDSTYLKVKHVDYRAEGVPEVFLVKGRY
jgi:hypothetical protein